MHEALLLADRKAAQVAQIPFNADVEEILSLVGDGVVSVDRQGRITLLNRAAEELFGYTSGELLGRPIEILIPTRFHHTHRADVHNFALPETSARRSMADGREVLGRHKDGREFAVEATLSRHMFAGQQTFTAVVRDVTDRKTAEQQRLLVAGEVAHRLRNTMAVVNSIVSLTAREATSLPGFVDTLAGRFAAISRTNDLLIGEACGDAGLRQLLMSELAAFQNDDGRVELDGPEVQIEGKRALDFALIFHELATNAAKYGALSVSGGTIHIDWRVSADDLPILDLVWRESGGPKVAIPTRSGFGSQLILRLLRSYGGQTKLTYPIGGVCCTVRVPLSA